MYILLLNYMFRLKYLHNDYYSDINVYIAIHNNKHIKNA